MPAERSSAERTDSAARIQRVTMPKWGLSMKMGKIVEWFVSEGDTIAKGDDVVDIETDKIAGTLESPVEGPLRRIVAEPGADLPVGAVLAVVARADDLLPVPRPRGRRRSCGARARLRRGQELLAVRAAAARRGRAPRDRPGP